MSIGYYLLPLLKAFPIKDFLKFGVKIFQILRHKIGYYGLVMQKKEVVADYQASVKYLNVGGGKFVRRHWRVLDYITHWYSYDPIFVDFNIDLERCEKWPIEDESYDLVYTSHTLEHLSDKAVYYTLKEIYRILRKGSGLRIAVPNTDLALKHYEDRELGWFEILYRNNPLPIESKISKGYFPEYYILRFFSSHLVERINLAKIRQDYKNLRSKTQFLEKYTSLIKDEWQREKPGFHRNWFNFERLENMLKDIGFRKVLRSECKKSIFIELCNSEFDNTWPQMSLYIDAIK